MIGTPRTTTFDCADPPMLAAFWRPALVYEPTLPADLGTCP